MVGRIFGECRLKAPQFPTIMNSDDMWCGEHSEISDEFEGEMFIRLPVAIVEQIARTTFTRDLPGATIMAAADLALAKERARPSATQIQAKRKRFWSRKR